MITDFSGPYRWLSNFSPSNITAGDNTYPTMEHYFQAHKSRSRSFRAEVARAESPGEAKRLGRGVVLRPDWESIKIDVMRMGLAKKFAPDSSLAGRLIRTQYHELVEGNSWGDDYWGMVWDGQKWKGRNWLGWLLMAQRGFLMCR